MKKLLFALCICFPPLINVCDTLPAFKGESAANELKSGKELIRTNYVCPDCGEWGCIYEEIDENYINSTDTEIETAVYTVCKKRGITDSVTISLLLKNYSL